MRGILGALAVLLTSWAGLAQAPGILRQMVPLAQRIDAMVREPAVARAHWGVVVTAMDGAVLYSLNEGQMFRPASNAKLFTTAAALALLGPERRFQTRVEALGQIDAKGVLHGNLSIVGGGDANFGSHDVPYIRPTGKAGNKDGNVRETEPTIADIEELADKTVAKGVKEIDGDVVGEDRAFDWEPYPAEWSWNDLIWAYGAPVSALTIHDNALDVSISAIKEMETKVDVWPEVAYYETKSWVQPVIGPRDCSHLSYSRSIGTKSVLIQGEVGIKNEPCVDHLAIEDPAEFAALAFKLALERRGVRVTGKPRPVHAEAVYDPQESIESANPALTEFMSSPQTGVPKCTTIALDGPEPAVLAVHTSPKVSDDVIFTNKVSQNQHAEVFLRNIGALFNCTSSQSASLHLVRQFLVNVGIDKDDFVFFDGSGLSGHDLVAPRAIAKLLQFAATQPWFAEYKASLPVGGVDGSLSHRFAEPPLRGHVFAKTGSLGESRALSGYLECKSGRTAIFSVMVDNHAPGSNADREVMDRIVAAIAAAE